MAVVTSDNEKPVVDDVSQLSDPERFSSAKGLDKAAGFEDPDAGLSEEERAVIVRRFTFTNKNIAWITFLQKLTVIRI